MTARGAEAIENAAVAAGAKACWRGMPVIMVVLWGGFVVEAAWCFAQNRKNRTFGDYAKPSLRNITLCADGLNTFASIVLKCAFAKDPALVAALTAKADEIEAAVFELKKPSDVGEGVAQNDYINLKQLNGRMLQSARELHEAKNAPAGGNAEPVVAGGSGPQAPRQDEIEDEIPEWRRRRRRI